jgi:hypothetical protein
MPLPLIVALMIQIQALLPQRPVGPAMELTLTRANGDVVRYVTGTVTDEVMGGLRIPVVETTVTTADSTGRPLRRLRERYALTLATATGGRFEVPDPAAPAGWREEQVFELREVRMPEWSGTFGIGEREMMRKPGPNEILALVLVSVCGAGQGFPAAQSKQIVAQTYYNTFSRAHPVLARVKPGETVVTKTLDASGRDDTGTVRARPPNPLTGPFYVEGAEAGDALIVRFTKVRMNRNWGWSNYRLGLYSLTPESIEGLYPNRYRPGEIIPERVSIVP